MKLPKNFLPNILWNRRRLAWLIRNTEPRPVAIARSLGFWTKSRNHEFKRDEDSKHAESYDRKFREKSRSMSFKKWQHPTGAKISPWENCRILSIARKNEEGTRVRSWSFREASELAERNKLETFERSSIIQIMAGVSDTRGHRASYRYPGKTTFYDCELVIRATLSSPSWCVYENKLFGSRVSM